MVIGPEQTLHCVDGKRLLHIATELVSVPSPTLSAGPVADRLAALLMEYGFEVERAEANWPSAPAVVVRLQADEPGPILQFDGHLDTVHLPFAPPRFVDGMLHGSGTADMKGGIAAAVEALIVLRDSGAIRSGGVLFTAHEHHEGPWGDRRQVRALIQAGFHGDAVLLPEYLADRLPVSGRGNCIFHVEISRPGEPMHEIACGPDTPNVVRAGVELINECYALNDRISQTKSPLGEQDSIFVGSIQAGEIYNQSPNLCTIDGVRRWVTPGGTEHVVAELNQLAETVAQRTSTSIRADLSVSGDAFSLDETDPIVAAFQEAQEIVAHRRLPVGAKPFVDDGNQFALFNIPAITHGPAGKGAHTVQESVSLDELIRCAQVYTMTAIQYCNR